MIPLGPPSHLTLGPWVGNLTLRNPGASPRRLTAQYVLAQLWTLCYEEHFHLVMGAILLIGPRLVFPGVWVVTGLVLFNLSSANPVPVRPLGVFTDGPCVAFATGVAVYYRLNHAAPLTGIGIEFAILAFGAVALVRDADPFGPLQTLSKYHGVS